MRTTTKTIKNLVFLLAAGLGSAMPSATLNATVSSKGIDAIPICMDFGCKVKKNISITQEEWVGAANWLVNKAPSPEHEREKIRRAVGWMEVVAGRYTPTHKDVAGNYDENSTFPGQLDCIDESLNTTTYLKLFAQNSLLHHHHVVERAFRRTVLDQHWAGQLQEKQSGQLWVVDSWFQHNGNLPYVQTKEEWIDIPIFTSYVNTFDRDTDEQGWLARMKEKSRSQYASLKKILNLN